MQLVVVEAKGRPGLRPWTPLGGAQTRLHKGQVEGGPKTARRFEGPPLQPEQPSVGSGPSPAGVQGVSRECVLRTTALAVGNLRRNGMNVHVYAGGIEDIGASAIQTE
jgi:hypothetical protein